MKGRNMSKRSLKFMLFFIFVSSSVLMARDEIVLNTKWIPSKPEVLTYRTISEKGNGSYQTVITKNDSTIEVFINMISPGFAKTVSGLMTLDMVPQRFTGKIIIGDQVQMDNETHYGSERLFATAVIKPNNQIFKKDTSFSCNVVDPSQIPFLVRVLQHNVGAKYEFISLNPQTNTLYTLKINVVREETIQKIDCYKVLCYDFEGVTIYWVEKAIPYHVVRIEQRLKNVTMELMQ